MSDRLPEVKHIAVSIAAIGALTILEVVALLKGIDGTLLIIVVGSISGLGGFSLSRVLRRSTPSK